MELNARVIGQQLVVIFGAFRAIAAAGYRRPHKLSCHHFAVCLPVVNSQFIGPVRMNVASQYDGIGYLPLI